MNRFSNIIVSFALLCSFTVFGTMAAFSQSSAQPSLEDLHNELRVIKQRAVDAVNSGSAEELLDTFSQNVIITAFNNDNVHGLDAATEYYENMMTGADRYIKEMSITAEADALSLLYADNTFAIVSGTSMAHFQLKVGPPFDIPLRWTATVDRSAGEWKFAALHFSANPVNNPLVSSTIAFWKWVAGALAVAGILLGYFLGRRKSRKA